MRALMSVSMARPMTHLLADRHWEMTNVLSAVSRASDCEGIVGKGVTEKFPDPVNARKVVGSCWMAASADVTLSCRYVVTVPIALDMSLNCANLESRVPRGKRYLPTAIACCAPLSTVPMRGPTLGPKKLRPMDKAVRMSLRGPFVVCGGSSILTIAATLVVAADLALPMAV